MPRDIRLAGADPYDAADVLVILELIHSFLDKLIHRIVAAQPSIHEIFF